MTDPRPFPTGTLELEGIDLVGEPTVPLAELTRFQHLTETERRRIIIRVLCGLVAMEEMVAGPDAGVEAAASEVETASWENDDALGDPHRAFRRRLPFLGLEVGGAAKVRQLAQIRSAPLLPQGMTPTGTLGSPLAATPTLPPVRTLPPVNTLPPVREAS